MLGIFSPSMLTLFLVQNGHLIIVHSTIMVVATFYETASLLQINICSIFKFDGSYLLGNGFNL